MAEVDRNTCFYLSFCKISLQVIVHFNESNSLIKKIELSETAFETQQDKLDKTTLNVRNLIVDFLDGRLKKLPLNMLDLSILSTYQKKVLFALYDNVVRGEVIGYGKLAKIAGLKSNISARLVGNVMASNPFPLFFPCHRVIKSDGSPGGFSCGVKLKLCLLQKEGIIFEGGKIH